MTSYDEPFNTNPYHDTRRNKLEHIVDVLAALQHPRILSRIMYKTNINCRCLKEILDALVARNLVTTNNLKRKNRLHYRGKTRTHYRRTTKGTEFLGKFNEMKQLWDSTESEESVKVQMEEEITA